MSYPVIEEETGTYTGTRQHRHNGYYAGDFRSTPMATRQQLDTITRMRPPTLPSPSS
jgi:hypothetical protein